jgi:hypothetical protein
MTMIPFTKYAISLFEFGATVAGGDLISISRGHYLSARILHLKSCFGNYLNPEIPLVRRALYTFRQLQYAPLPAATFPRHQPSSRPPPSSENIMRNYG